MIVYVTRWLGGYQGAGKSAWDALGGVLATGREVQIVVGHSVQLPEEIAGHATDKAQLVSTGGLLRATRQSIVSKSRRILTPLLREPKIASVLHTINDRLQTNARTRSAGTTFDKHPSLAIVNSLGSHDELVSLNLAQDVPTALIVRESPGHYRHEAAAGCYRTSVETMSSYDALIFVSDRCREAWMQEPTLQRISSFYIPNCCEEDEVLRLRDFDRGPIRRQMKVGHNRFVAVCIASLQPRKGQDLIIEQLPRIVEQIPNFELHLVGSDSRGFGKKLRKRARATGVSRHVRFHGASDTALASLHAADALLLPTRAEAMPRVVLEAMAIGTPVIATDVDGIPELIDHDQGGWLFPVSQPEEMLTGLLIAANDPQRSAAWVDENKRRYWQEFSQNLLVRRYADVVNSLATDDASSIVKSTDTSRAA